jgi:hypothetical protein
MRSIVLLSLACLSAAASSESISQVLSVAHSTESAATAIERSTAVAIANVEEWTFIKSHAGKHQAAVKFIKRNWFAMDEIAKQRGLILDYQLLTTVDSKETETNKPEWDIVVRVRYPNIGGYESIADDFEQIRRAHQTVLIDGKNLRDLARIVRSDRLLVR